jgi:hypothetical protein
MSDDLIKRLQDAANGPYDMTPICAELLEAITRIKEVERERDAYAEQLMVAANTFSEMHAENEQLADKIFEMKSSRSRLKLVDGGKS